MSMPEYNRRDFLKAIGFGAASLGTVEIFSCTSSGDKKSPQPNILWLSCEDISPHLGCYGDPNAVTPTLDRLAEEGVRYDNSFTIAGVCAPTRSCIITGMYPTTLGTHHMRAGGEGTHRSIMPALPPHVKCFSEYLREAGYYCTNNVKEDYNFDTPESAWDESSNKAHWRNRPKSSSPFFAVFNYTGTHEGSIRLTEVDYAKRTQLLNPTQRQDPKKLTLPPYYPDTPITRHYWARYYELITALDYWAADMLRQLEEDGLAEDTIVFFWSDHGVAMPRAKRWLYESGTRVPLIVRIPKKFRINGQGRPGTIDDQLISSVDFAETVLNLAMVSIPEHMQGRPFLGKNLPSPRQYVYGTRDRMDERYDIIRTVRDKRYRYIRNYEPFKPYYQYIQTAERGPVMQELRRLHRLGNLPPAAELFMANNKPVEELYDLQKDPYEIHNLAGKPEYGEMLERMRAAHVEWMLETKDLGLFPEPELVELEKKYGSRYAFLRQPGREKLLQRLRSAAVLGGRPEQSDIPMLIEAMKDENAAIRYWSAIGLGNLNHEAKSTAELLKRALNDRSAIVRIASARALCMIGMETSALPVLISELKSQNEWVRLNAAIVLDEIGEKARPAIDALKEALKDKENKYVVRVANHALNVLLGTSNSVR